MRVWDTSAVLPLLWREEGGDALQAVLAADGDMAVWWGTKVEAASAICRSRSRMSVGSVIRAVPAVRVVVTFYHTGLDRCT